MRKNICRSFIVIVSLLLLFFVLNRTIKINAKNDSFYAKDFSSFQEALKYQKTNINVSDIDFNNNIIIINYSLKIYSDSPKTFKNAYFVLSGPNILTEAINVEFENITFDGGFSIDSNLLNEEKAFEDIFGSTRDNNRCISINFGYANLSVNKCVITNYASEIGPAIFLENEYREASRSVTIKDSKFYNNYSLYDTVHLSNDLMNVTIDGSEFYGNYGYKGQALSVANGTCNINNCNIHDNHYVSFDVNKGNVQLCGGGVFIGGTKGKITNTTITNNESYYGGGIGIASQKFGENQMVVMNTTIKNNKAVYGGGIAAHSLLGQPITFINCDVSYNQATNASIIYTTVYGYFNKSNNGGLVEFLFSSFIDNTADDLNTLSFYLEDKTKGLLGSISLKGCLFIGNDTFNQDSSSNYATTLDKALDNGLVSNEEDLSKEKRVNISKQSDAYIKINQDEYRTWSKYLSEYKGSRVIGYNGEMTNNTIIYVLVAIIVALVLSVISVILVVKHRKKTVVNDVNDDPLASKINEIAEANELSDREKEVFRLTIEGKKRKEIASLLFYSENTVKKDLTSIYKKLEVSDKSELMIKYKYLL